ncbi:MAG TPA: hypothetical protein VNL69_10810 [Bacteroidota bacterium]|nr:hypothetical protein [Bacteroidota bacterium]
MRTWVVACAALLIVAGCKDDGTSGRICTTEARAGIQLDVRDALTGEPAAEGALAYALDGSYADTLDVLPTLPPQAPLTMAGVFERPGVYTVVVRKTGYRDWMQVGVVVRHDGCHVITVMLDARLERVQ